MSSVELPQFLLDQDFSDTDEYARNIGWDFDFRQLDAGALRAHGALLGTSRTRVMRIELNRAFHQTGLPPNNMLTFGLSDPDSSEHKWCGRNTRIGDLLNFSLHSGFEGVSHAGFGGFAISFEETLLQEVSEVLELNIDYRKKIRTTEVWRNADRLTSQLRHRLFAAKDTVPALKCADAISLFNSKAAALLLEFLSGQDAAQSRTPPTFRDRALRMTIEWLEATSELPLTVMELCKETGFSAPTLYRAFMDEFGIGPKRYLQIRRLTEARRELKSECAGRCISDIANRLGFWHMGSFAADYKAQFGELPSETLRKRASIPRIFVCSAKVKSPAPENLRSNNKLGRSADPTVRQNDF
jgi:AraC-like DNA-binding protein